MLEPFGFDRPILAALTQQLPDYKLFFYLLTQLGSPLALAILASPAFVFGKDRAKIFSAILAISLLFSIVVVDDVKFMVQRPRPEGARGADIVSINSYSFPSGHAFTIFLAVSILGAYFGWKYYAIGYAMAIAVCLSRIYLGVHYPSDIAIGAIMGATMGEFVVFAAYRLGLCDSQGLLSFLLKPGANVTLPTVKDPGKALSASIFLVILASIALYFLGHMPLVIFTITAASIIILIRLASHVEGDKKMILIMAILATCLIASLSMLFMGAYAISLVTVIVAYFSTVATTYGRHGI